MTAYQERDGYGKRVEPVTFGADIQLAQRRDEARGKVERCKTAEARASSYHRDHLDTFRLIEAT